MNHQLSLKYDSPEHFIREIKPDRLSPRTRVTVLVGDGSEYKFTYMNTLSGELHGISALNGRQISINIIKLILTEH